MLNILEQFRRHCQVSLGGSLELQGALRACFANDPIGEMLFETRRRTRCANEEVSPLASTLSGMEGNLGAVEHTARAGARPARRVPGEFDAYPQSPPQPSTSAHLEIPEGVSAKFWVGFRSFIATLEAGAKLVQEAIDRNAPPFNRKELAQGLRTFMGHCCPAKDSSVEMYTRKTAKAHGFSFAHCKGRPRTNSEGYNFIATCFNAGHSIREVTGATK